MVPSGSSTDMKGQMKNQRSMLARFLSLKVNALISSIPFSGFFRFLSQQNTMGYPCVLQNISTDLRLVKLSSSKDQEAIGFSATLAFRWPLLDYAFPIA